MICQVVEFGVAPSSSEDVKALVNEWANKRGKRLVGCNNVSLIESEGPIHNFKIVVEFSDQQSLDRFSEDLESLEYFERVKPFLVDTLNYFEASLGQLKVAN